MVQKIRSHILGILTAVDDLRSGDNQLSGNGNSIAKLSEHFL